MGWTPRVHDDNVMSDICMHVQAYIYTLPVPAGRCAIIWVSAMTRPLWSKMYCERDCMPRVVSREVLTSPILQFKGSHDILEDDDAQMSKEDDSVMNINISDMDR